LHACCEGEPDTDPEFAAWDESLKADRINPGTTADLTVAALLIAGLSGPL
jgi:triphosphoribosyl-dephospho-CoA synthase